MRNRTFEKKLLDFASRTEAELNPASVAHALGLSIEEARDQLDRLAKLGALEVKPGADGGIAYDLPGRAALEAHENKHWDPKRALLAACVIWGTVSAGALGFALFGKDAEPPTPRKARKAAAKEAAAKEPWSLTIVTDPFGAAVYEGEALLGLTPLALSGKQPKSLRIVKPGFETRHLDAQALAVFPPNSFYQLDLTPEAK